MPIGESTAFGALLRRYREAAQLTQRQLAERVSLSTSALSAVERGARRPPPAATVELLADTLNLLGAKRAAFRVAAGYSDSASANSPRVPPVAERPAELSRPSIEWIPTQPTPLVDRLHEVSEIVRMLVSDSVRLLTLVGPAGVGKTRLALAVASEDQLTDQYRDGVILVDLTPIRVPQDVPRAIARACGVTDTSPLPLGQRLVTSLLDRATLLVLDNFEQVLPAAAELADLLARCPGLTLLVTSRAPLQIRWEQTLRVAPLPVPDLSMPLPLFADLATIPSVTLFLQRARARRASFALTERQAPAVAHLVAQLDGLPLALELAAASLDVLSLSALTQQLANRMQVLTVEAPDLPERQRSLEAAVGWSYDLLSEREQRLFRCLGVFVGRVSLGAIAAVESALEARDTERRNGEAADERGTGRSLRRLLSLAEKSLILPARQEESGALVTSGNEPAEPEDELEPAFGMLETVREYAWERLAAAGELTTARQAHAHYFLALALRADAHLRGHDQLAWYRRLEREQDNLRAALRWLLEHEEPAEREAALRLVGALGWFWRLHGYHTESARWAEEALARVPTAQEEMEGVRDPAIAAEHIRGLVVAGALLTLQGEVTQARSTLEEALSQAERWRVLGSVAEAHVYLGFCAAATKDIVEANKLLGEALRRWEALGDAHGIGLTLVHLAFVADMAGEEAISAARYTEALRWLDTTGDVHFAAYVRCYLGVAVWKQRELPSAVGLIRVGAQVAVTFRDRWLLSFVAQATAALVGAQAAPTAKARLLGAVDALAQVTGATFVWERLPGARDVAALRERLARGEGEHTDAFREGRRLSFGEVATTVLRLLDEASQSLPRPEQSEPARQTTKHAGEAEVQPANENPLTAREVEVLRLVAQGLSSKLIARQLSIAPGTVNYHLATVFNKLGVDTRAQAVAVATQRGLL